MVGSTGDGAAGDVLSYLSQVRAKDGNSVFDHLANVVQTASGRGWGLPGAARLRWHALHRSATSALATLQRLPRGSAVRARSLPEYALPLLVCNS